jgi:hypothetical protein
MKARFQKFHLSPKIVLVKLNLNNKTTRRKKFEFILKIMLKHMANVRSLCLDFPCMLLKFHLHTSNFKIEHP